MVESGFIASLGTTPPRAAYVHVPFCRHRCGYCNFSVVARRDDLTEAFLRAIERELSWLATPRQVDTIYLGGGTPTHLSADQLRRLLATVRRWLLPAPGCEWSVEANPSDLNAGKVEVLRDLGVNRISLGAQSFQSGKLEVLERDHDAPTIARAAQRVREAGMALSLDLIFAAPGETYDQWCRDLDATEALEPDHISTYGLTFEKGTRFWNRRLHGDLWPVDEQLECRMYLRAIRQLTNAGWEHYEVSNFALPGRRCRHSEVYWSGGEYYGFGPGAARHVAGRREVNHRSTTTYLRRVLAGQSPLGEREELDAEQRARERLVFGLRRLEGVERDGFRRATGYGIDQLVGAALQRFTAAGLLEQTETCVRLTPQGLLVSDSMWPDLL